MTNAKRNDAIEALIREHTKRHTTSKAVAREALLSEGIYTPNGDLRVEFGGTAKKAKPAA